MRENFDPRNDALGRCCSIRRRLKVSTRRWPPQDCTRRAPNDPVPRCGCRACAHKLMGMHGECAWAWVLLRCTALKGLQGGARYVVWRPTRPHQPPPNRPPHSSIRRTPHNARHSRPLGPCPALFPRSTAFALPQVRSFRKAAGARGRRRSSTKGGDGSVEHLGPSFRESRGYRTTLRVRVVVGRDEMKTRKKQFYIDHVDRAHLSIRGSPRLPSMPPPFPSSTVSLSMQSRARTCANNKQQEQGQRHDVAAK